jgi:hypothetical protein
MENTDLGIYTAVIVGLFILFGIGTYRQFRTMNKNEYSGTERIDDEKIVRSFLTRVFG